MKLRLSSIVLAVALVAGTAPTLGVVLADGEASSPGSQPAFDDVERTRAALEPALADVEPAVDDGFDLASTALSVQQDSLDDEALAGMADVVSEQRGFLDTVTRTVALAESTPSVEVAESTPAPSDAVAELADEIGVELSPEQRADVQRLDELPSPWPGQLAEWIRAFAAFQATTVDALADIPKDAEVTSPAAYEQLLERTVDDPANIAIDDIEPAIVQALDGEELASIHDARDAFLAETLELRTLAAQTQTASEPDVQACPVLAVGLANEDTTYTEDCRLILDLGGSDTYENNAGGAWTKVSSAGGCLVTSGDDRTPGFKAAALVDLAGQDDVYGDVDDPRACGVNGGAAMGSGFLLDDGGDDLYVAGGPSSYAHGAVNGGTATLIDLGGSDSYLGERYANAQGFTGSGLLYDASGHDEYIAGNYANGAGGGGQAALIDAGGNDRYEAASSSNGAGVLPGGSFLLDAEGSDTYRGTDTGTNGGGWAGSGLLVDLTGDDLYEATSTATNGGGSFGGVGTLFNVGGDDVYRADSGGTNGGGSFAGQGLLVDDGGDDRYVAGDGGVNGGASLAGGLLLDGDGHDTYEDRQGGTGTNKTLVPKGQAGAQIDVPHPPSQPEQDDPPEPPADDTPDPQPHVIVGDPDSGINPYHEIYHRPDLTEHPCTYIPDFPCDIPALNLTLDAENLKSAFKQDLDEWKSIEPGEWYWIPGTAIVAASCSDDGAPCLSSCSIEDIESDDELNCSSGEHGTHTSSSVLMENPDALIAFRETAGRIAAFEDRGIPVDLYTVSYGSLTPAPVPTDTACPGQQDAPLYVVSAGNTPYSTFNSCRKGDPGKVVVGGAYAEDNTEEGDATKNPEVVSYYCRPTADDDSIDRYETACGTSFSTPTVAGALSKTLLEIRQHTGYAGTIDGQVLDPDYGDDGLTVGDLREAMNRTATYDPTPRYENTDTSGSVPLNPIAPWVQWGWGFYDADNADRATDHLLGEDPADPRPEPVRAYMQAQHTAKTALYGDKI